MEVLIERGFAATGQDALLRRATLPKGSFRHQGAVMRTRLAKNGARLDTFIAGLPRKHRSNVRRR
jgi:hypothetical protein